jgi:enediyne biosynthesis protein E4
MAAASTLIKPLSPLLLLLFLAFLSAQAQPAPQSAGGSSGIASGAVHPPEYDSAHRPITSGGQVKTGPIVFLNVAKKAGLEVWHHTAGTAEKKFIVDAKGSGVALLDYDNDGWLDIYLVSGSNDSALDGKVPTPKAALFHNNHDGTFTNVAANAGVTNDRWGYGAAVADFDNDGWPDIYVTNFGKNRLYRNNHDGTFTDVAEKAGVALGTWSTGATFGDYDGDSRLDLFVAGYVHYDRRHPPVGGTASAASSACRYRGTPVMCGPRGLQGEVDHLFHNNGDGTFTDVSVSAGVSGSDRYYGLGALFADVNNDGKVDLLVANDSTPNYLYINKGNGTFEDRSYPSGYALDGGGREKANMGIAAGDFENNGHLSVVNTAFSEDNDILYRNDGLATFTDVSYAAGIASATIPFVGFGDGFLDYDNDGWLDLLIANGHVYPDVDQHPEWGTTYKQRTLLFHNLKNGKFELVPAVEGTGLAEVSVGRGAAFGDLFNDGKMDVVINNADRPPTLLRNVNSDHHHWVELKLVGGVGSPRDAVGATVYLTGSNETQRGDVLSGGSYLSSNDPRVHFGLGDASALPSLTIYWPSGTHEIIKLPAIDRIFTVAERKGITADLCTNGDCPKLTIQVHQQ